MENSSANHQSDLEDLEKISTRVKRSLSIPIRTGRTQENNAGMPKIIESQDYQSEPTEINNNSGENSFITNRQNESGQTRRQSSGVTKLQNKIINLQKEL